MSIKVNINTMNVALFFTYDMSLKKWDETGLIEREILYYNQLVDKYPINFTFVTFGDEEDFKYQDKLKNIKIIPIYYLEKRFKNVKCFFDKKTPNDVYFLLLK